MQESSGALPVVRLASEFARIGAMRAQQANAIRQATAEANIAAARSQADLAAQQERSRLSQEFARHVGTLAVNAAYRGSSIGDAGFAAAETNAALLAAQESVVIEANRDAQIKAAQAREAFVPEDVALSAIEFGLQGFQIGSQIQSALQANAVVQRQRRLRVLDTGDPGTFGFEQIFEDVARIPGFEIDLAQLNLEF